MDGETCYSFLMSLVITLIMYVCAEIPAKKARPQYTNSQISVLIAEHIHSERDRAVVSRRLMDKVCYEALAEEFQLSVRQTKKIVSGYEKILFDKLR